MARPPTDIRERIIRAARVRFLHDGVDGASMRAIAREARTSLGMITYYFASKDDLFVAVFDGVYEALLRDLEACLAGEAALRDKLHATIGRVTRMSDVEREVVRLVAREAMVSSTRREKILDRFVRGHLPLVLAALSGAAARGEIDASIPLPIAMVATGAISLLPHFARQAGGQREPFASLPEGDALSTLLLDALFRGIGPRVAPAPKTRRRST